jgi:hypothetical protein
MGHPEVENHTPFIFEALFLADEEFRPLIVPLLKATFTIGPRGECRPAEEQIPISFEGEYWGEDPATSSYKYEPEIAFFKPGTDVVVIGHAHAPRGGTTQMDVGVSIGPLCKSAIVFGDRVWFRAAGGIAMSRPIAFEKMPLMYERAFGGWNRLHEDSKRHFCELQNPAGVGMAGSLDEGIRMPNVEDPSALLRAFGDRPSPAGFGFVSPHWQPRARFAGTYDEAWSKSRAPLLPRDFDRRYLNAASPGLVAPNGLRGDESVTLMGMSEGGGPLSFALPAVAPPLVRVQRKDARDATCTTRLDTVIIEPDDRRVILLWRGHAPLRSGPHDVRAVHVSLGDGSSTMPVAAA